MVRQRFLNISVSLLVIVSLLFGGITQANARSAQPSIVSAPASPTDESKVPHYFGPYPNWANSPFRLPKAFVEVAAPASGVTASADAVVDPQSGVITAINVTNPGSGYTSAPAVTITGLGVNAAATALVDYSGVVNAITVDLPGSGYTAPTLTISGGGATTDATATAFGGVDAVSISDPGLGYSMPTVEFGLPNDPNGVQATGHADMDSNGAITAVVVDNAGSGYSSAPSVTIHNGTVADPIAGATLAIATSTISIQSVALNTFGSGYTSAPSISFSDAGAGTGATATAAITTSGGSVTAININNGGSGYMTPGIKKFTDQLPGLCVPPACPLSGKYIPVGVPEAKTYNGVEADEYVIGLVQYRTSFSSSLPDTFVRGYVQLETPANAGISQHFKVQNELLNGSKVDTGWYAVTPPQYLGPTLIAQKDRPVRIVFYNLLPTGTDGDLFLPVDSSMMGAGMVPMNMMAPMDQGSVMDEVRNPICTEFPKGMDCFKDNRATLHLHGGTTPWISDGTPHQWITPANEDTPWPQGVSVQNVPDMDVCNSPSDGCQTFYYTNQQSARLMFYHDHAWGITRLNVYAGEAAGYLISDSTEQALVNNGLIPADQIPLVVQDRTFVPDADQLAAQDPTWDTARWGTKGNFWYHHVYMPAQNPGDPSGMSAYGRWMYGPWFWPPAADTVHGPIDNPYYDPNCNLDDPSTWQYQTDPFCEPAEIPGTPNISVGMEQFNDTPIVNGVAYPTTTVEPKAYRLRILNAANDRFFNFQWYVADPTTGTDSEVALKASELAAAQEDPNVFPTPDTTISLPGPDWIQIGTEGGFLPAPVVINGHQPTTWITDPTRFDVGNVDQHSLLLAPAERADVIVDFSKFAGKTLILYNDAPAAFPARVASYDYYTGAPDLSPVGAPSIVPGYGPNTRTVMQIKVAAIAPASAFNLTALQNAFKHNTNGTGVFESGQHPIIVGQAAYNSAYGTSFASASNCNVANKILQKCDGLVRVNNTSTFGFNTLASPTTRMVMPLQPKAIHDEMNATTFDEFGRMQANLGVEAQPPSPGAQNVTLYPYVNPATELIDGTNLPKGDLNVTKISSATDGTQIWRITHNGVDTHPIHFHLFDVQLLNRVTWDNIIIPPDPNELGWKDTVRVSPLEDTIVALRPIIPTLPFEIPNSVRLLNPMMPAGNTSMFNNVSPQGNPTANITNRLVNFGWEYVYHCHILSHEEMDMMRPVSLVLPPKAPDGLIAMASYPGGKLQIDLTWNDNSIAETSYVIQRMVNDSGTWVNVKTIQSPLDQANTTSIRTYTDISVQDATNYKYQVVAQNTVGYGAEFPSMTAKSTSNIASVQQAFIVSGNAGIGGATIAYGGSTTTADINGNYSFIAPPNWTGTITPSLTGYTFSLPSITISALGVTADLPNQNFTAIPNTYTVSGALGTTGATVAFAGTTSGSAIVVGSNYSFVVPYGWTGTITPSKTGYTFAPLSITVSNPVAADLPGQSFTATLNTYTVSGALGVSGATVAFAGTTSGSATVIDSNYSFVVPYGWIGTITPSKTGYTFTPLSISIATPVTAALPNQDFTATINTYAVSGALDVIGATVAFSGTTNGSATVVGSNYSFVVPYGWTGTITPSKTGYTFAPLSIDVATPVAADLPGQDFTATLNTYTVSGALGTTGATVAFAGTTSGSATVVGSNYSFVVPYGWIGTITPAKTGYTFTPLSLNVTMPIAADLPGQDFTATLNTYTVSGALGVTGATVAFSGTTSGSAAVTGSSYSFVVPYGWTGTITPSRAGYTFTPLSISIATPVTAALPNQSFTVVPLPPAAPTNLTATLQAGPQIRITWRDNANNESGLSVERSVNGGAFTQIAVAPARTNTGNTSFIDATITPGNTYRYRVAAVNALWVSAYSNTVQVAVPAAPAAPSNLTVSQGPNSGTLRSVVLKWVDNSINETGFTIQYATNATFTRNLTSVSVGPNVTTTTVTGLSRNMSYYFRIRANNGTIVFSGWVNAAPFPIRTNP